MNLNFEIDSIRNTEFGVGRDVQRDIPTYTSVPTDDDVKRELANITSATVNAIDKLLDDSIQPRPYSPSEKYSGTEYLILPLEDENCQTFQDLFNIDNLQLDSNALQNSQSVFCYFTRLTDTEGERLVGLRRASQFKSVKKDKMMGLFGDTLTLVDNPLFALNNDFDLLIDSEHVHILRPSGFEYMGKLQEAILNAVPGNISAIRRDISFVNFDIIEEYAQSHPRAARYLASILTQNLSGIDSDSVVDLCQRTGSCGRIARMEKITVQQSNIMGFLEVLDRRRYENELVPGQPESFRASSRQRIGR